MKLKLSLFLLIFFPILVNSQEIPTAPNQTDANNKKQGKWLILYDTNWKVIQEKEKAAFYRTITYQNNKPVGKVIDWYKNGKPQMIADSLIQEAPAKYEGNLTFFREDGSKEKLQVYKDEKIIEEHFFDKEGNEVEDNWESLTDKGGGLYKQGKYEEAQILWEKAKIQAEKEFGKKNEKYASALNNLAVLYQAKGLYKKTESLYLEAKDIYENIFGKKHPDYAFCLGNLGSLYERQGLHKKAKALYSENKQIYEEIVGKKHPYYAKSCMRLAGIYQRQGLYGKAESLYLEAKQIYEEIFGKTHFNYGSVCNGLALLYDIQGLYEKAETFYLEAKDIFEEVLGKKHPYYARVCNNLAVTYHNQGLYDRTEFFYLEAKQIYEEVLGKKHPSYATSCNNLAELYFEQKLYSKSESLHLEAIQICEEILGKKHPNYASFSNNLAQLYQSMGLYEKAKQLMVEAKQIREDILGKKHPNYANSCHMLAFLYSNQGLYEKAESLFLETKKICEEVLGKKHPLYAISCENLALLYRRQNKNTEAKILHQEAKQIREEVLGKKHPDYAFSCHNLGSLYYSEGLYTQAEPLLLKAKEICEKYLDKKHHRYIRYLHKLAQLYKVQKSYVKSEDIYTNILQDVKIQVKDNFPNLTEIDRKQFFQKNIQVVFTIYNSFVLESSKKEELKSEVLSQMYNNRIFSKSLLFNSSQKVKERVLTSGDSTLVENYQRYLAKLRQYNKVLETPIADRKIRGISADTLYLEAQELEKQISKQSSTFAKNLEEYQVHTWQEVQATLQKNEVAIEIIRFRGHGKKWTDTVYYAALIVSPETKDHPAFVVLENGNDLENKYSKNYYQKIDNKQQDGESYLQFWQPIEDKLQAIKAFQGKKKRRIYISLDGAYYQINLHTLQNPQTGKYLEEDYEIQIVSNTKDLLQPASQFSWEVAQKDAVELFGYPLYDTFPDKQEAIDDQDELDYLLSLKASNRSLTDSTDRGRTWHILFGTKKEVHAIEEILQPKYKVAQHIRTAANETALKKLFSPPILHIATHGYFLADIPQDTTNRQMAGTSTYDLSKNPLLRSGLILAGANHTWQGNPPELGENGILTAQEAKELNLDHTQLVVLSACETGKGAIQNGEGIFGLQRAFLSAGSDFVLNSLWKVDDEATQILMTYFYKHLLKYSDIRKALKKATQDLRKYEGGKFDAPKYWGAFVLVGR